MKQARCKMVYSVGCHFFKIIINCVDKEEWKIYICTLSLVNEQTMYEKNLGVTCFKMIIAVRLWNCG